VESDGSAGAHSGMDEKFIEIGSYTYYTNIGNHTVILTQINDFIKKTIFSIIKDNWISKQGGSLNNLNRALDTCVSSTDLINTQKIRGYLMSSPFLDANKVDELLNIRKELQRRLFEEDKTAKATV